MIQEILYCKKFEKVITLMHTHVGCTLGLAIQLASALIVDTIQPI